MCEQCGKCCHRGDFWQYSQHPLMQAIYQKMSYTKESGQCLMLEDNLCLIEKHLGKQHKPNICNTYDCKLPNNFKA